MGMQNTLAEIVSAKSPEVHTLTPDSLVSDAIEKMKSRNIGALVILGTDKAVIGIFSERDLLNRVVGPGLDPKTTKLSDVMTAEPICVETSMTVEEAMQKVTEKRIRHLPLVSAGKLQGLISSRDLTAWAVIAQKAEIDGMRQKLASAAAKNRALIVLVIGFCVLVAIGIITK